MTAELPCKVQGLTPLSMPGEKAKKAQVKPAHSKVASRQEEAGRRKSGESPEDATVDDWPQEVAE
jgi:hypothetical protein